MSRFPTAAFLGRACAFASLASALALPCYGSHHAAHHPTTPVFASVSTIESTLSARCNTSIFLFHHHHSASSMRNLRPHHGRG